MSKGKQTEKIKADYNTDDYFKHYKHKHCLRQPDSIYYISQSTYTKVLKAFFQLMMNEQIYQGNDFILPYNMGVVSIRKVISKVKLDSDGKLINHLPIDFGATNKLWAANPEAKDNKVLIRHLNKHTNGYVFKFMYNKNKSRFKNKTAYRFEPTRTHKRMLAKLVKGSKHTIDFLKSNKYVNR